MKKTQKRLTAIIPIVLSIFLIIMLFPLTENSPLTVKLVSADSSAGLGESFTKYENNPLSLTGNGVGYGSVHPDVLYFSSGEDGYKYWMYYEVPNTGDVGSIYLERSNDGITWTSTGISNPIVSSHPVGGNHVADPDVLKVGSTWYLWVFVGVPPTARIYLFTSSNGKTWTSYSLIPVLSQTQTWEANRVSTPSVIYETSISTFFMWYAGVDASLNIKLCLANSTNGYNWTKSEANPIDLAVAHEQVIKYNGIYWMYAGHTNGNMFLWKSTDKKTWTPSDYNPVLSKGTGWEGLYLYRPSWLQDTYGNGILIDNSLKFFYSARATTGYYRIGLANSTLISEETNRISSVSFSINDVWYNFNDTDQEKSVPNGQEIQIILVDVLILKTYASTEAQAWNNTKVCFTLENPSGNFVINNVTMGIFLATDMGTYWKLTYYYTPDPQIELTSGTWLWNAKYWLQS